MPRTFDMLNTNGGHIIVGFALLFVGAGFSKFGIPKGEDLIVVGMTLIGRAMMDQHATWSSGGNQPAKTEGATDGQ
jgi:hypothetical protein